MKIFYSSFGNSWTLTIFIEEGRRASGEKFDGNASSDDVWMQILLMVK